ncbi:hypothetical protein SOV_17430 [Sporomusa ovata DSM 2662]|nr:hypothetical protein SOV_1c10760 [Sporomusa ovata DSM 2662]
MGSKSNKGRLCSTPPVGINPNVVWNERAILETLSRYLEARDFRLVNRLWKALNLYEESNAMVKRITGFSMDKVEPVPIVFTAKNGEVVQTDGGYYPLYKDPRASIEAELQANKALYEEQSLAVMPFTETGYTKGRLSGAHYSVDLELSNLYRHINDVTHDIAFRPVMNDFRKLLRREEIKEVLRRKLGDDGYRAFRQWLNGLATGRDSVVEGGWDWLDDKANVLRERAVVAYLLFRPATALQNLANPTLYGNAVEGFGEKEALRSYLNNGWGDYIPNAVRNTKRAKELREYVFAKSALMRDKMENPDYTLREFHEKGKESKVIEFGSNVLAYMDQLTDIPMWLGAYELAEQRGLPEAERVRYADTVIERSSGSSRKMDVAQALKGTPTQRLFTMFYTFLSTQLNRWQQEYGIVMKEKDYMRAMTFVATKYLLFGALSAVLSFRWLNDEDDDNPLLWWAKEILSWPHSMFPVVGSVVKVAAEIAFGSRSFGYSLSSVERGIGDALKVPGNIIQYLEGKRDIQGAAESATGAAAFLFKYPDQFNDWFWNAYDMIANDMTPEARDIIRRRPKKER